MPLYEYHCRACDHEFEVLVRGGERPACPECGAERLEKLLSVPSAHSAESLSSPQCSRPASMGPGMGGCGMGGCGMGSCGL